MNNPTALSEAQAATLLEAQKQSQQQQLARLEARAQKPMVVVGSVCHVRVYLMWLLISILPKKLFIDILHKFCAHKYQFIDFERLGKNLFIDKLLFSITDIYINYFINIAFYRFVISTSFNARHLPLGSSPSFIEPKAVLIKRVTGNPISSKILLTT